MASWPKATIPAELDELYRSMTAEADAARDAQSLTIGRLLAQAANPPTDGVLGVEHLLDRIVAPLAEQVPVLVVVLDGMGWPSFLDVDQHLARHGWAPLRDEAGCVEQSMVAALPTVTEFSRTSLLSGELTKGDAKTEKRRFAAHPALAKASQKSHPPELFHRAELKADGGIDARPTTVEAEIEDTRRRVIGVVINNIDERLKEVANPPSRLGSRCAHPARLPAGEGSPGRTGGGGHRRPRPCAGARDRTARRPGRRALASPRQPTGSRW